PRAPRCALRSPPGRAGGNTRAPKQRRCRRCIRGERATGPAAAFIHPTAPEQAGASAAQIASRHRPRQGRPTARPRFAKLPDFPRHERTSPMTEPTTPAKAAMPLHWKIGIGFFLGLAIGLFVYYTQLHTWTPADLASAACMAEKPAWYCGPAVEVFVHTVTRPFGQLFLSLIFMLIVPLLFSALVMGVTEMGDIRALGRIGWRTLGYTILLSGIAVVLGLVMVDVFK